MRHIMLFLIFLSKLWASSFSDFEPFHDTYTKEEIEAKIKTYLQKTSQLSSFYSFNDNTFAIGDLRKGKVDFTLRLKKDRQENQKVLRQKKGLKGAKIAVDPGHFGGSFAALEERSIAVKGAEKKTLQLDEGTITYLTAMELKRLLEEEGAEVFVTRKGVGMGALPYNFFEWLKMHPEFWSSKDSLSSVFRKEYNREDLRERAKLINEFDPDIALIIHYNGHRSEEEKRERKILTTSNFNVTFVPGSFCENELATSEDRYEFLRLLLTDVLEESIRLSTLVAGQLSQHLGVPLVAESDHTNYSENVCLKCTTGVYARNLALTRLIHCPLCYGESLVQNNMHEIKRLSAHDTEIEGVPCSLRLKEVAKAYFNAIKEYFAN